MPPGVETPVFWFCCIGGLIRSLTLKMAASPTPRDRILGKLDAGDLPRKGLTKMYAGYGKGYRCAACDRTITPYDVEYEMDFSGGVTYRMHQSCAAVWQAEWERRADGTSSSSA
jgi:hypothetical protein